MQQTDYTCEEILEMLKSSDLTEPRCLLVNELGGFAFEGDDLAKKALWEILDSEQSNINDRFASFCSFGMIYEKEKNQHVREMLLAVLADEKNEVFKEDLYKNEQSLHYIQLLMT